MEDKILNLFRSIEKPKSREFLINYIMDNNMICNFCHDFIASYYLHYDNITSIHCNGYIQCSECGIKVCIYCIDNSSINENYLDKYNFEEFCFCTNLCRNCSVNSCGSCKRPLCSKCNDNDFKKKAIIPQLQSIIFKLYHTNLCKNNIPSIMWETSKRNFLKDYESNYNIDDLCDECYLPQKTLILKYKSINYR